VRGLAAAMVLVCLCGGVVSAQERIYPYAIPICSVIINEMTEEKINLERSTEIAHAIAEAGNVHFDRVTCGDMWLYMAIVFVESGFRNNIINYQNCWGMFQVHAPSWAGKFGIHYEDLLDPEINAHCGVGVFKYYLDLYKTPRYALSAYNSDHPTASLGYAAAVLATRERIKRRFLELYRIVHSQPPAGSPGEPRPSRRVRLSATQN
jgi:hypothetical protein